MHPAVLALAVVLLEADPPPHGGLSEYTILGAGVPGFSASGISNTLDADTPERPSNIPAATTADSNASVAYGPSDADSADPAQRCSQGVDAPVPVDVAVTAVPIVVESTTEEYFVLYVRHDPNADTTVELPVLVTRGEAGTTTLSENVAALPRERYRVEKYLVADPADIDGDCIDDVTELEDPVGMNPVNPAAVELSDGVVALPDRATFETFSFHTSLGESIIKFLLFGLDSERPRAYFMNTKTYGHHRDFLDAVGLEPEDGMINAEITYYPQLVGRDGRPGVYVSRLPQHHPFSVVARIDTVLAASMPLLEDNLAYHIPNDRLQYSQPELPLYWESRINLVFDADVFPETHFLALNPGEGYGLLRVMDPGERPHPRDIVIYEALPNELPRVAGIVSTVPQTPLSHVNLRAIQDGVPNAFIPKALDRTRIAALNDSHVHYIVTESGYEIRAATLAEVDAHYAASRPATDQTPQRDLSVTQITALSDIEFDDWTAFGVKAANVAVLRTLGFSDGTVPDGFAVPFYFYDEFMKYNGFYDDIEEMLADSDFQSDFDTQESELKKLRKKIKKGDTPEWINTALTEMHAAYPEGQSLRYRSSTNNEDLPGFNGAGLYDSKTQHPEETEEDGIAKSLKQVFASLWNFRAFTEREFHRIDHLEAAMGVLVHPNYSDELANGVAVSFDPIDARDDVYYVNTQIGEDLVTNPEAHSVPEEILLHYGNYYNVLGTSNQVPPGQLLLTTYQMTQLRRHLEVIHEDFKRLYMPGSGEPFAMEIEFKITSENILAIKQARPWVFSVASARPAANNPATGAPTISGTAQVDETLTADTTGIADEDGLTNVSYTYQWMADDADISGATGISSTLVQADENKAITVQVSFTDDREHQETLTSSATAAVAARPNIGGSPDPGGSPGPSDDGVDPDDDDDGGPVSAGFEDVDAGGVHAAAIDALFAAQITAGCSTEPLRYCPDTAVTRAQMASLLARALDLAVPEQSTGFEDVDAGGVHAAAIDALFAAQITAGCSTEPLRYCPDTAVTRAQMASLLARALDLAVPEQSTGFEDVDAGGVHAAAIDALFAAQITAGCSTEPLRYCPDTAVTRAQMASLLARALDLAD